MSLNENFLRQTFAVLMCFLEDINISGAIQFQN